MAFVLQSALAVCVALSLAIALPLLRRLHRQWSLRKIPGPPSTSLLSGNFPQMFRPDATPYQDHLTATYGSLYRLNGFLGEQVLVTSDIDALHHIVVKHVDVFDTADWFLEVTRLMWGRNLLSSPIEGGMHRKHRKLMNPAFSIGHMKRLFPLFIGISKQVRKIMVDDVQRAGRADTDVLKYMSGLALELIAQGGFGHKVGVLDGPVQSETLDSVLKRVSPATGQLFKYQPFLPSLTGTFPPWLLRRVGELLPFKALHELFYISDTLQKFATSVWVEKKHAHAEGKVSSSAVLGQGRDILSLLLEENDKTTLEDKLPESEVMAQVNLFLFAGTDTSSNALSRILHMLALHPEAQSRLREELVNAGAPDGDADYDTLDRLPYLEAVCRETLRLFPPVRFLRRRARQDHLLPLQEPVTDVTGKLATEVFVPKGTSILCNIAAVNVAPFIWGEDAQEWKPERWLGDSPHTGARVPSVYGNMLTFAGGARSCIGFKFSLLEMKAVLAQFIPTFKFEPSENAEIVWRFGGITSPGVKTSKDFQPQLPLRVSCT
ncbi:cytochrome P450 [Peniophora sp. CONT]|nr:cytochrome P450 [Peniophora sp. CONT]